jgi:hypothetical protein
MADLATLLAEVPDVLQRDDPSETAALAIQLAAFSDQIAKSLEPLKKALRGHTAPEEGDTLPAVGRIPTEHGEVRVTFPRPKTVLAKNADVEGLRNLLGPRFDAYFDTKVTYTPVKHITDLILTESRTASDRTTVDAVLNALESKDQTPRVAFRPS